MDIPGRARSGGPSAPDRGCADGPEHAPAFARIPPDPEQRAVSGGEEEDAEDRLTSRAAPRPREWWTAWRVFSS